MLKAEKQNWRKKNKAEKQKIFFRSMKMLALIADLRLRCYVPAPLCLCPSLPFVGFQTGTTPYEHATIITSKHFFVK